jgi:predicted Zn-dependent peptidase
MQPAGAWADFRIFDLDSHVTLFVQPTDRFKNVTARLFVRTHLADDPSRTALLPHVLMRGTRRRPTMRRITEHLEGMYGASADAEAAKFGESHVVAIRADCVADRHLPGKPANVRRALGFLAELWLDPARNGRGLRSDYVEQERHLQVRALEDLMSDRGQWAEHRCLEAMCRGEAYATHEMGTLEGLARVTPESLAARHRELVETAPAELYVSGRVDPEAIAEEAERLFRVRGRGAPRAVPETVTDVPVREERRVTEAMEVEQGKLVMGWRTYTTYRDRLSTALSMLNGIFGGFAHSRMFVNVREREGLAYAAGSSTDKSKGLLMAHAGIDVKKRERCEAVIREEMESIREGRISDEELEATRRGLIERARSVLDSPGRGIVGLYERRLAGRVQTVEEVVGELEGVKREDVVEAARRMRLDTVYFLTSK